MTIDEWAKREEKCLRAFVHAWKQCNIKNPENWPLEQEEGDWDDHYFMHDKDEAP